MTDHDFKAELEALRLRVDILERSFERIFGGPPSKYQRARTRLQTVLDVTCPACGAEKGLPCMTSSDKPTNPHLDRVKASSREMLMKRSK